MRKSLRPLQADIENIAPGATGFNTAVTRSDTARNEARSALTIFDDFGEFVLTARAFKRAFVMVGFVWLNTSNLHPSAAARTFRMRN